MKVDVMKAYDVFFRFPETRHSVSKGVYLKCTFKRIREGRCDYWSVIVRAIDKKSDDWFIASASPHHLARSRAACLRAALFGLADSFKSS
jgi:hypothetical protein